MPDVTARLLYTFKDESGGAPEKASGGLKDLIEKATGLNVASLTAAGGVALLAAGLKASVAEAAEAESIFALTQAQVKATGMNAGFTANELLGLAKGFQYTTAYSDEAVLSMENVLLRFESIRGPVLKDASKSIIDMATALGIDLTQAARMVGRALEDPRAGLMALRRAGVVFSEDQKNVIKNLVDTGQAAKAQAYVLEQLNNRFGGAAQAQLNTYAGSQLALKNAITELEEEIGRGLLPALTRASVALKDLLFGNMQVDDALKEHSHTVASTSTSYAAYTDELNRAALAGGHHVDVWGRLIDVNGRVIEQNYILTRTQYEAVQSTSAWADASDRATARTSALGSAAEGASGQIEKENEALLKAGLSGVLGKAEESYAGTLKKLSPEIEKTRKELQHLEAIQGKVYMATKLTGEANLEHYNLTTKLALAQNEHALAAYRLNEAINAQNGAINDGSEGYLKLQKNLLEAKIAFDGSSLAVRKLNGDLDDGSGKTIDNSKKIAELKTKLGDLTGQADQATAALQKTTSELIYQSVSAGLDAESSLSVAKALGLIDQTSYDTAKAAMDLRKEYDAHLITLPQLNEGLLALQRNTIDAGLAADGLTDSTHHLNAALFTAKDRIYAVKTAEDLLYDKEINIKINVSRNDEAIALGASPGNFGVQATSAPKVSGVAKAGRGTQRQHGGRVSGGGMYTVGEAGPEAFFPSQDGYVLGSSDIKELIAALKALASRPALNFSPTYNSAPPQEMSYWQAKAMAT